MKIVTKAINTIFLLLVFSSSLAEVTAFEELQYDSDKQVSIVSPTDPSLKWQEYLSNGNIQEGTNSRNERIFLIAYGESIVGKATNDSGFMDSRTIAYNKALLSAKEELAASLRVELESSRSFTMSTFGDEVAPSVYKEVVEPLSIMDKANTLMGLALDNEIKKFDPTWDGTNKTDDERIVKMADERERYTEYISQKARMFLQGATPIFNAEGPNDEGKYTVVVGIVWSGKSTRVAESVYNPTVASPQGKKNALTIQDRLDNLSDEELAATLGVRIWWDEEGLPVIVSFAQAKGTGSTTIAKKKTAARARTQIAQFVAEQIESEASEKGGEEFHYYDDGSHQAFDQGAFEMSIQSRANLVQLSGLGTVLYKKIKHPITNKKIAVNVVLWSPEANMVARGLSKMSSEQETKMDATDGGTVFENYQESTDDKSVGTITTIGLEGVSSDPDDF